MFCGKTSHLLKGWSGEPVQHCFEGHVEWLQHPGHHLNLQGLKSLLHCLLKRQRQPQQGQPCSSLPPQVHPHLALQQTMLLAATVPAVALAGKLLAAQLAIEMLLCDHSGQMSSHQLLAELLWASPA